MPATGDAAAFLGTMPEDVRAALIVHHAKCQQATQAILREYGSAAAYRARLTIAAISCADAALLPAFYDLYRSIFTLPEEQEPLAGFSRLLTLNTSELAQSEFGPFRESIVVAQDPRTNAIIAAVCFALYAYTKPGFTFDASCQIHFLLVRDDMRGIGIGGHLLEVVEDALASFARHHRPGTPEPRAFLTCEQNNPERMTLEQMVADARAALIDPYTRMSWWRKRGFKRLDFAYTQPPLSAGHDPCTYLDYYARPSRATLAPVDALPAADLIEHLRRFFFVGAGKLNTDMGNNPQWLAIQAALAKRPAVALL